MSADPLIAFEARSEPPALEIRVNFGLFAGREATAAELDDLAEALLPLVEELSVVGEHRHEVGTGSEVSVHQVRVEVAADRLPDDEGERERLVGELLERAERWANERIAERHVELGG